MKVSSDIRPLFNSALAPARCGTDSEVDESAEVVVNDDSVDAVNVVEESKVEEDVDVIESGNSRIFC